MPPTKYSENGAKFRHYPSQVAFKIFSGTKSFKPENIIPLLCKRLRLFNNHIKETTGFDKNIYCNYVQY